MKLIKQYIKTDLRSFKKDSNCSIKVQSDLSLPKGLSLYLNGQFISSLSDSKTEQEVSVSCDLLKDKQQLKIYSDNSFNINSKEIPLVKAHTRDNTFHFEKVISKLDGRLILLKPSN